MIKEIDKWMSKLNSLTTQIRSRLITLNEFEYAVKSIIADEKSPIRCLEFEIIPRSPFETIKIGKNENVESEPTSVHTISLDSFDTECKIRLWKHKNAISLDTIEESELSNGLHSLIKAYWKKEIRDDKSHLLSLQYPSTYDLVDEFLIKNRDTKHYIYFCDLDKFKLVNDNHGEKEGDRVILEFAALLENQTRGKAIPIHRSGDEFILLYPIDFDVKAIDLIYSIMNSVSNYNFNIGDTKIGVSSGISILRKNDTSIKYKSLEEKAEKAVKPAPKIKHRGMARFNVNNSEEYPNQDVHNLDLALCLMKNSLDNLELYKNVWLNYVAFKTAEFISSNRNYELELSQYIGDIISWINPNIVDNTLQACITSNEKDYNYNLSYLDILFSIVFGISRAVLKMEEKYYKNQIQIIYTKNGRFAAIKSLPKGNNLFQIGNNNSDTICEYNYGHFHSLESDATLKDYSQDALLIKIGHEDLIIPYNLFSKVITIDDRPTRGGGLPDFWEATIASMISHVVENANTRKIFVIGNHNYAIQTINKLKNINEWQKNIIELSHRTGLPANHIEIALRRIENNMIVFSTNENELLSDYSKILRTSKAIKRNTFTDSLSTSRFLTRDLNMSGISLERKDGCRVKTISEAFPIVLEIARNIKSEEIIVDQAGQKLVELMDFKVHLLDPTKDKIPSFYSQDKEQFEKYFINHYLDKDGLFANRIQKNNQLEVVLDHLISAICDQNHQFATRRAILIVPPATEVGKELLPLGLVSIRFIPRFYKNKIKMHYSFTWRTVEALVGFPYSIYGSVNYAIHLTELLQTKMPRQYSDQLEIGELSYIAHSLHIFMDHYGQNIARRIVDDASS